MRLIQARNEDIFGCLTPEEMSVLNQTLDKIVKHVSGQDTPAT
jgi:hypothetical protein